MLLHPGVHFRVADVQIAQAVFLPDSLDGFGMRRVARLGEPLLVLGEAVARARGGIVGVKLVRLPPQFRNSFRVLHRPPDRSVDTFLRRSLQASPRLHAGLAQLPRRDVSLVSVRPIGAPHSVATWTIRQLQRLTAH